MFTQGTVHQLREEALCKLCKLSRYVANRTTGGSTANWIEIVRIGANYTTGGSAANGSILLRMSANHTTGIKK